MQANKKIEVVLVLGVCVGGGKGRGLSIIGMRALAQRTARVKKWTWFLGFHTISLLTCQVST